MIMKLIKITHLTCARLILSVAELVSWALEVFTKDSEITMVFGDLAELSRSSLYAMAVNAECAISHSQRETVSFTQMVMNFSPTLL